MANLKSLRLVSVLMVVAIAACASGTALVTGTARPAIAPEQVKLYLEPPPTFEVIALVEASSGAGMSRQESLDYATDELKEQAAKLGANGVLLESSGTTSGGAIAMPAGNTFVMVPTQQQTVRGRAIWVPEAGGQ